MTAVIAYISMVDDATERHSFDSAELASISIEVVCISCVTSEKEVVALIALRLDTYSVT
jgi:hypothetical protein